MHNTLHHSHNKMHKYTLIRSVQSLIYGNDLYHVSLMGQPVTELSTIVSDLWPGKHEQGLSMLQQKWSRNGMSLPFYHSIDLEPFWYPNTPDVEWFHHVHSFEWLRDLHTCGGNDARRLARQLVISWLKWNMFWNESTWSPTLLARRVVSWIANHDFFWATAEEGLRYCILNSLARQTRHLIRVVPSHRDPWSLLLVAKGLLYGSLSLRNGHTYRQRGLKSLNKSLSHLILNDGGVVDRSPYSHYVLLCHLIDIRGIFRALTGDIPHTLHQTIERMVPILHLLCHGDEGLALFHHSRAANIARLNSILPQVSSDRSLYRAVDMKFERLVDGPTVVIIDVGPPPPCGFNDMAHASTLAFELSSGTNRIIVNCGSCFSDNLDWKLGLRNTTAHSTLTLANTNSSEIGIIHHTQNVHCKRLDNTLEVIAQHDGYGARFGFIHERRLGLEANGERLIGQDTLIPVEESETMRESVPFTLRFHLHPAIHAIVDAQEYQRDQETIPEVVDAQEYQRDQETIPEGVDAQKDQGDQETIPEVVDAQEYQGDQETIPEVVDAQEYQGDQETIPEVVDAQEYQRDQETIPEVVDAQEYQRDQETIPEGVDAQKDQGDQETIPEVVDAQEYQGDQETIPEVRDWERKRIQLQLADSEIWYFTTEGGDISLQESIYFGSGLSRQPCSQIVICGTVPASGCRISWTLERVPSHKPTV